MKNQEIDVKAAVEAFHNGIKKAENTIKSWQKEGRSFSEVDIELEKQQKFYLSIVELTVGSTFVSSEEGNSYKDLQLCVLKEIVLPCKYLFTFLKESDLQTDDICQSEYIKACIEEIKTIVDESKPGKKLIPQTLESKRAMSWKQVVHKEREEEGCRTI